MDIDERLSAVVENEGIGTLWLTDDEGETRTIGKDLLLPLLEAYEREVDRQE